MRSRSCYLLLVDGFGRRRLREKSATSITSPNVPAAAALVAILWAIEITAITIVGHNTVTVAVRANLDSVAHQFTIPVGVNLRSYLSIAFMMRVASIMRKSGTSSLTPAITHWPAR